MDTLELRPFAHSDCRRVAELVNDWEIARWTSSIPHPYSVNDAVEWIDGQALSERTAHAVIVAGELVGCVTHWPDSELQDTMGLGPESAEEVGYWIGRHFWGRGIASRALETMMQQATFPGHKTVVAKVMKGNVASERVLLKCRFERAGDCQLEARGQTVDALLFVRPPSAMA